MARRKLPLLGAPEGAAPPTMAALRARLGGRLEGPASADAGRPVTVGGEVGVLLSRDERGCDVWLGDNRVKRAAGPSAFVLPGPPPSELAPAAQAARRFADLREGERVSFVAPDGRLEQGLLFEKCRFGALVARDDGSILGVGFQRLFPARSPELN
ncbi:MAG TPA: hypothetical protein VFS43_27400 [Polyangiaceae bacterium]|nr:hypothetical protein [Polyangiaceae bacterium]